MSKRKIHIPKVGFFVLLVIVVGSALYGLISLTKIGADVTNNIKKSIVQSQARFQINPKSSWDSPTQVSFRVAAGRYMFIGSSSGGSSGGEGNPKVTGRFFCNKPFISGYNYPTGLYEPPDYIFQDGSPFAPTDVMDGHNGMSYTYLPGDNYQGAYNNFWAMTVASTYTATCNYTQPGEYWPLFFADGLSAWYTQRIVITSNGVAPSPIPSLPPIPSVVAGKDFYKAGFNVVGFSGPVQTDIFGKNGFTIYSFNSALKKWDISSSTGQYLFQANQAYYVYSPADKYINKITTTSSDPVVPIKSGWNFIWVDSNKYLGDISLTVYGSQNQCSVKYAPLRLLKNDDIVYKWIYNVVDGQALDACHAFSLLTGKDLPSTSCSATNPLLNEVSYAKAKTGLWVYLWPGKVETWAQRNAYPCK